MKVNSRRFIANMKVIESVREALNTCEAQLDLLDLNTSEADSIVYNATCKLCDRLYQAKKEFENSLSKDDLAV